MNQTEQWTSKLGFILAAAGSAIGLGAIWKFPYVAGTSGGGAFFIIFLVFTLLVGLPLLLAEFVIGRSTQKDAITAYKTIAPHSQWHWLGYLGIATSCILLSFYSVVGGWIVLYLLRSFSGLLTGGTEYGQLFQQIISDPWMAVGSQFIFLLLTILVVARGVQEGIEKANKYMMPALFILFVILIFRSLTLDGEMKGVTFFLYPDFSKLTSESILYAMGQSFFSLSIGVSVMVTYSSYLAKNESLPRSALTIVGLNVLISLLAGLAIFPAVFSLGLEPTAGPGLLFIVLPSVFAKLPFGGLFLTIFLVLFLFATLTSAFSLVEITVASLSKGDRAKRKKITWLTGMFIFLLGIPSALSYGVWSETTIFGKVIFDVADFLVSNILLPLGALLIAIFVPLKMKHKVLLEEITAGSRNGRRFFALWLLLLRYVTPIAIIIVFLDVLNVI